MVNIELPLDEARALSLVVQKTLDRLLADARQFHSMVDMDNEYLGNSNPWAKVNNSQAQASDEVVALWANLNELISKQLPPLDE